MLYKSSILAIVVCGLLITSICSGTPLIHNWSISQSLNQLIQNHSPAHRFGRSIVFSNNELIISAPGNTLSNCLTECESGSVYSFSKGAHDKWELNSPIIPPNPESISSGALFGYSLDANASWLAIGAPNDRSSNGKIGKVYIFKRANHKWNFHSIVTSNKNDPGFGEMVKFGKSGLLYVGAPQEKNTLNSIDQRTGSIYIFRQSNDSWGQHQKISENTLNGRYGLHIKERDGILLVSAPNAEVTNVQDAGLVFLYTQSSPLGEWVKNSTFSLPQNLLKSGSIYGLSTYIRNNSEIYIASQHANYLNSSSAGLVIKYRKNNNSWDTTEIIESAFGGFGHSFGRSVAIDSSTLIIAASNPSNQCNNDCGNRLFFYTSDQNWQLAYTLESGSPRNDNTDFAGNFLFTSPSELVVTSSRASSSTGNVYIFKPSVSLFISAPSALRIPPGSSKELKFSIKNTDQYLSLDSTIATLSTTLSTTIKKNANHTCLQQPNKFEQCSLSNIERGQDAEISFNIEVPKTSKTGIYDYNLRLSESHPELLDNKFFSGKLIVNTKPFFNSDSTHIEKATNEINTPIVPFLTVSATDKDEDKVSYHLKSGVPFISINKDTGDIYNNGRPYNATNPNASIKLEIIANDGTEDSLVHTVYIRPSEQSLTQERSSGSGSGNGLSLILILLFSFYYQTRKTLEQKKT